MTALLSQTGARPTIIPFGVKNGSTLEMPTPGLDAARELIASVESGKISEKDIDERVDELLDLVLTTTENAKHYKKRQTKRHCMKSIISWHAGHVRKVQYF